MASEYCSQSLQGSQADTVQNVFSNIDFQSFNALVSAVQYQEQNRQQQPLALLDEEEQQVPVEEQLGSFVEQLDDDNHDVNEPIGFDREVFLEEIRKYRCLWDTNAPSYKERTSKANAWRQLSAIFNKDVEFLQKQLKNLKDNLKKCLDKRTKMTRSGAAASSLPKCRHFEQMAFLHGKSANKPTESNLQIVKQAKTPSTESLSSSSNTETNVVQPAIESSSGKRKLKEQLFTPSRHGGKIKQDAADILLIKQLGEFDDTLQKAMKDDESEDTLYCKSLIPIMKQLPLKKKRLAKIKISQLLYKLEFDEDNM